MRSNSSLMENEDSKKIRFFRVLQNNKVIQVEQKLISGSAEEQELKTLILVTDISNLQKYKEEKKLNQFKTVYFASIAHDLRTPINTILSINSQIQNIVS